MRGQLPLLRAVAPPSAGAADAAAGPSLEQVLRLLWRRKQVILASLALGMLLAGLGVHALPERYRAATVLLFQPAPGPERAADAPANRVEPGRLASEIEVLRSRGLLEAVVKRAELLFEPEFNASLKPARGLLVRLGLAAPPSPAELRLSRQRARTLTALRERMSAYVLGRSRAVEIAVESADPDLAARVANAIAHTYLERRVAAARRTRRANTAWLDARVEALRARVQAADQAVADYRLSAGLVARREAELSERTIAEVNRALIAAGQARSTAEARLRQAESLLADGSVAAEALDSERLRALRAERADLRRRRSELAIAYGPRHPSIVTVTAELIELQRKLDTAAREVVEGLRREAAVARGRERELRRDLETAGRAAGEVRRAEVELAQLEREAAAERALFETFLARLKETAIAADPPLPAAEVITEAAPPLTPASPNRPLLLGLALMACGVTGVGLAFAAEALDRGFRDLSRLEAASGRAGLGLVPRLRRGERPAAQVLDAPHGVFAEAVRSLHTAILLADPVRRARLVMLTSALPGEGKTSLACALARLGAAGGQRVLLLDADLRHPGVAPGLSLPAGPGLGELLAGRVSPAQVIRPDPAAGRGRGRLDVVTAGRTEDPAALLAAARLDELLDELARPYDLVLVDAPPVLAVAEPRALAPLVDCTVVTVRWAHTPRQSVLRAMQLLHDAGGVLAGGVLTQVDLRRHAQYGTGEGGGDARYYAG